MRLLKSLKASLKDEWHPAGMSSKESSSVQTFGEHRAGFAVAVLVCLGLASNSRRLA